MVEAATVILDAAEIKVTGSDAKGGQVDIIGTNFVSIGGDVDASGETGGTVNIEAGGLSLASAVRAKGTTGIGGSINIETARQSLEPTTALLDVSGSEGGTITHIADQQITTSGTYLAKGTSGIGGAIDVSAPALKFLSGTIDASGETGGGQVRLGGEFQGGKNLETDEIPNAQTLAMTDGTQVKVDTLGTNGDGGTAIVWADQNAVVLGNISAKPGTESGNGGFVEVSSGDVLTFGGNVTTGIGDRFGTFLLDPKNITITDENNQFNQLGIILGLDYADLNPENLSLDIGDNFGYHVSLDGNRLAVASQFDDGSGNAVTNSGAVYLYSFSDSSFSGASLQAIIGDSYTGGKNIDQTLEANDEFGTRVSLDGNRLAVGAHEDDGFGNGVTGSGAVYLYSFTDASFTGGNLEAIIGDGYTGGKNIDHTLETEDGFGFVVSLDGNRLAITADDADGSGNAVDGSGEVYLYSFTDSTFSGGTLEATIGDGFTGGKNIDQTLDIGDEFGTSASLDGNRLAVGAESGDGFGNAVSNSGEVYLYSFTDSSFSGGTLEAIIGDGYTGGKNIDQSLDSSDNFAPDLSLDGNRLAVGAYRDDGATDAVSNSGAVYLYSFTDSTFSGGTLEATMGSGYSGGKNVNQSIEADDAFGFAVSLDGNRLAVGADLEDGFGNAVDGSGAVYLYTFTDSAFSGATLKGIIGDGYTAGNGGLPASNLSQTTLDTDDNFGTSISLDGTRLAVGASGDDDSSDAGNGEGAVYLYSFADSNFNSPTLQATIGDGYTGGKNIDISSLLDAGDLFGWGVSLDGTRLAVGSPFDDGQGNSGTDEGAAFLFTFTDSTFTNNGSATDGSGALQAIIGEGYNTRAKDIDISSILDAGDGLGLIGISLDGDRLAAGSFYDDGQGNTGTDIGAAYLFTFTDSTFANNGSATDGTGALQAIIGEGYNTRAKDIDISSLLDDSDNFGKVSLDGTRLAVGAEDDQGQGNPGTNRGAAYLFTFTDSTFANNGSATDGTGALQAIIGEGYNTRAKDIDVTLDDNDQFARSVFIGWQYSRVGGKFR